MAKEKANRKRCVQVKFRLTPEENAVLQKDVKDSGLTKNDYIIKTIINRVGLSVLSCERRYCSNSVDIHFMLANKRIGYALCLVHICKVFNFLQQFFFNAYILKWFNDIEAAHLDFLYVPKEQAACIADSLICKHKMYIHAIAAISSLTR